MKFMMSIEYDGTNYSGWQKQNNAKTVQGTLIKTIEDIFNKNGKGNKFIDLQGSGRTDAGVHALEQVAHLECETNMKPDILMKKINEELPGDINILEMKKCSDRFHARHTAKSRQYVYKIAKRKNIFEKKYVWHVKEELDIEKMKRAMRLFLGMHDFINFSEKNKEDKSTKVLVEDISITETDNLILIRIKASHFLWKMVRRIVGTLVEVGRGNMSNNDIDEFLNSKKSELAGIVAPPTGLFLEKISY